MLEEITFLVKFLDRFKISYNVLEAYNETTFEFGKVFAILYDDLFDVFYSTSLTNI